MVYLDLVRILQHHQQEAHYLEVRLRALQAAEDYLAALQQQVRRRLYLEGERLAVDQAHFLVEQVSLRQVDSASDSPRAILLRAAGESLAPRQQQHSPLNQQAQQHLQRHLVSVPPTNPQNRQVAKHRLLSRCLAQHRILEVVHCSIWARTVNPPQHLQVNLRHLYLVIPQHLQDLHQP